MIVIQRIVIAWLLLGVGAVQADGVDSRKVLQADLFYMVHDDGLVANIPAHDSPEVVQLVQAFRAKLESRQTQCAEEVENTRFKTHDTLISIVMPGGLLYAFNKQQRHDEAKQTYTKVSQQLYDLKEDLARLKASSSQEAFALLD
jgi:hypothetical protein